MQVSTTATPTDFERCSNPTDVLSTTAFRRVVAGIDTSGFSRKLVPHAVAIAEALRAPLTLLRVLEVSPKAEMPPDPVQWGIRRREAHEHAERLAAICGCERARVDVTVVEGQPAEQICQWARGHEVGIMVVGTHGPGGAVGRSLGDTARRLVDQASGALLFVPSSVPDVSEVHYRRLLVPLDGSSRAESVLPLAMRLAKAEDAELLLTHVIPIPELTEIGPLEAEDIELRDRLIRRNERVARQYLEQIKVRLSEQQVAVRYMILSDADARSRVTRLAVEEGVDLIVLSAHGRSGRRDVSWGSFASYLVTHAAMPLLLMSDGVQTQTHYSSTAYRGTERLADRAVL